ncbi:peptidoglycan DD-metalloendopeptidase family protein [Cytophagaceae bacterium ABcell3]|nr:peptidoglycan DD-metalloendopeptidase family protein [Cytophagaceae bacterium ABcell3]
MESFSASIGLEKLKKEYIIVMKRNPLPRILLIFLLTATVLGGYYLVEKYTLDNEPTVETEETINEQIEEKLPEPTIEYGMIIDSMLIEKHKVKRNENLSQIFRKFNIPYEAINEIANLSKDVFDPRYIRAGHEYTIYTNKDSLNTPQCLVYDANQIERIVYKFDSLQVYKHYRDVDTIRREIGGVIYSSIYETLNENNASQLAAIELSKIFATQVDFFRLQKGERFRMIYDELVLDGQPIGISNVAAASFDHRDRTFYAFNHPENGVSAFYDEEGNSTQKGGFLKAPLKYFRITSHYTKRRYHPVQKRFKAHLGTDYAAPTGTPIISVGDGVVVEAKYSNYNGNYVKIKHNNTYSTQYLHMSKIAKGMRPGVRVSQGQVIGYVGSTGLATGPHVCFRFWENGKQVDGTKVKVIKKEPIKASEKESFMKQMAVLKKQLDKIPYLEKDDKKENEEEEETEEEAIAKK